MDAVLRALFIYGFLLILIRITGRRTLSQMTTFDFVLLLIIGESTQQALLGQNYSITNAAIVITTLLGLDLLFSLIKQRSHTFAKWAGGVPMVIVQDGRLLQERMDKARVGEDDIMESARRLQGIERLDQIRIAMLETNGNITVIPKS
jgi:uncharacterized membrane protein YcaP (DUF421 family)